MSTKMIGHAYSNGQHYQLQLDTEDLEEFLVRTGWMAADTLENVTSEGRAELDRLQAQDFIYTKFNDGQGAEAYEWWMNRVISVGPAVTNDI